MTRYRSLRPRSALCYALLTATVLTGCGIQVESMAQTPLFAALPDAPVDTPSSELSALAPCVPGVGVPHAASVVTDLLLGADRYATDCARQARPIVKPAPLGVPARTAPSIQPATGIVTDELIGAVLTGTSEYWHRPVIGPA